MRDPGSASQRYSSVENPAGLGRVKCSFNLELSARIKTILIVLAIPKERTLVVF